MDAARGSVAIPPFTGAADAFAAAALAGGAADGREPRLVLAVTPGIPESERLQDDLETLSRAAGFRALEFPPEIAGDKSALGSRMKAAAAISAWSLRPYPLVVATPCAALENGLPAGAAKALVFTSASTTFDEAKNFLASGGYERVAAVTSPGEWSQRGGIVDFWSPAGDAPVRAEFFGEELESLRSFDPATQLSTEKLESASAFPAEENGEGRTSLIESLPENAIILACGYGSYEFKPCGHFTVYAGGSPPNEAETFDFATSPLPGFAELGAAEAHHPELFDAARKRLETHLEAAEKHGKTLSAIDELSGGFETASLVVVTKADRVFAKRRLRSSVPTKTQAGERLRDFSDLEPGEYVVHVNHGVGRYVGSSEIVVDGKRSEVYTVEYADGAKLHVPATHAHLLSKYVGVAGAAVELHKLDGKKWTKDRLDAEKAVKDLAVALLETQAKRSMTPGFAYDVECDGIEAFEAAFPYTETEDQLKAIADVKKDLSQPKPMDRLVCGDAGYGKTEVAMRAAYIAAMNGKQTAVLAPTTVLAEQHLETFMSRFDGTPIRIESVSRLQSKGARNGTFERLANGVCDIVIGTHALLSPKTRFRDLGLVIVDEEQRFGVRHKEYLKRIKATADVLTLSATPIPRTLYLSMTGTRDLSILRTPPRERVAVETTIVRGANETVKAAIEAEIERGGQVFYLHNRIATIYNVQRRLMEICPKAKSVIAHGRMDSRELAARMRAFEKGEYDILLSTTIVESGIDIPSANTIIVDRADTFGLADLYQLRGRVGRSSKRGRALLLLPPDGLIDAEARERMDALRRHGGLGAGFDLAVRDLELRGAGNLLGAKQSGHIAAVGFTLYCQLLRRTIAKLKGEKAEDIVETTLNLDFTGPGASGDDDPAAARIPYSYIEDDAERMDVMRRAASAATRREVAALGRELADRFGPVPAQAKRLLALAALRAECAAAGISRVDAKNGKVVFRDAATGAIRAVKELKKASPDRMIAELSKAAAEIQGLA